MMMNGIFMKITEEILCEIKSLYLEGNSINDIRNIFNDDYGFNISFEAIRKRLRKITELRDFRDASKFALRKHIPKDEIIHLYVDKEVSLRRLAKMFGCYRQTLSKILRENDIKIREKEHATRLATLKHKRFEFNGTETDKTYLIGLVEGDLTAFHKSNHTIRIITNTTHYAFAELIKRKFKRYGYVRIFPTKNRSFRSYMWCVQVDLDNTFDFLLPENRPNEIKSMIEKGYLVNFLAGFIDSDGSVIIRKAGKYYQPIIRLFAQNLQLLNELKEKLEKSGYNPTLYKNFSKGTLKTWVYNKDYFTLEVYKRDEVFRLLKILPIEHPEKIPRKYLALMLINRNVVLWKNVKPRVEKLKTQINKEIGQSILLAKHAYIEAH